MVLVGLFATYIILVVSLSGVLTSAQPERVLALYRNHAAARSAVASEILDLDRSLDAVARARALALDALRRDATQVSALTTLAMASETEGNANAAINLIAQSWQLSRRDRRTQLWLIGRHAQRGDVGRMIQSFDIAVRTTQRGRDALLTLLVSATDDAQIVPPLRNLLDRNPEWFRDFARLLILNGRRADIVQSLLQGRLRSIDPADAPLLQLLLDRLVRERRFDLAWSTFVQSAPTNEPRSFVRNGSFERPPGLTPFDWILAAEADLSGIVDSGPNGGRVLRLIANSGRAGEAGRQLLRLEPGGYEIRALVGDLLEDQNANPTLTLTCADIGGSPLFSHRPARQVGGGAVRLAVRFRVPAACRWQWLAVRIGDASEPNELEPWIDDITIHVAG